MDSLQEIVKSFNEQEIKQLKKYIGRKREKENRKDIFLLNILRKYPEKDVDKHVTNLYNEKINKDAYHQLRKTLFKRIEDFIRQQNLKNDKVFSIMQNVAIAKYYFSKKLSTQGWKYLLKAEQSSIQNKKFDLLNLIYHTQIQNTFRQDSPDIEVIIKKRNQNLQDARLEAGLNTIYSLMRYDLKVDKKTLAGYNINQMLDEYISKYKIDEELAVNPKLECEIIRDISQDLFNKKEYHKLETFLVPRFNKMIKKNIFDQTNHQQKLKLLELLCQTYLKNKKYSTAEQYFHQIKEELLLYEEKYNSFIVPISTSMADILYCTNRLDEGIALLNKILYSPPYNLSEKDLILLHVNLAGLFFGKREYSIAAKEFSEIQNKDSLIENYFGRSISIVKCLCELIIFYENNNSKLVGSRIKFINKKFGKYFHSKEFQRENLFFSLVKNINKIDDVFNNISFRQEVESFNSQSKFEPGSIEVINFNAWLKSKIEKRSYYEVFLEMASHTDDIE